MPRALDLLIATLALVVLSPFLLAAAIAIKLGSRGPVIYRQRRVGRDGAEFEMWKLRTMVAGLRPGRRRHRRHPRRPPRHRRRPLPPPHLARRGPQPGQRAARRDGDRRPAPDHPRPGRRLHPAPEPPPRGPARDHRLGPGPGPRRHPLGGADRARRRVRRAPLRSPSTPASSPRPSGSSSPARASPPTDAGRWADVLWRRLRPVGSVRVRGVSDRPEVSLRRFEPGDARRRPPLVQQPGGDGVADGAARQLLARAGRRLGAAGDGRLGRGPQVRDRRRGLRGAGRLHRPLRPLPPDRAGAGGADRRRRARQGRRPPRRGADDRQGLRRVRRPPRLRPHPRPQRDRQEDRHQPRLEARGDDARPPRPRGRAARRLRGLGRAPRRVPGRRRGPASSERARPPGPS